MQGEAVSGGMRTTGTEFDERSVTSAARKRKERDRLQAKEKTGKEEELPCKEDGINKGGTVEEGEVLVGGEEGVPISKKLS